jgi:hypothetical protein
MDTYRITLKAWGKRSTHTLTTDTQENAILIARQTEYQGMCAGDMVTDVQEGRVPILKVEREIIDDSKDTLDYIFVPIRH